MIRIFPSVFTNRGDIQISRSCRSGDLSTLSAKGEYYPVTVRQVRRVREGLLRHLGRSPQKLLSEHVWLKDTLAHHVQNWLNQIGAAKLSRNTLKHVKSVISGIFTLAKQQDYFQGENPARDFCRQSKGRRAAQPKHG